VESLGNRVFDDGPHLGGNQFVLGLRRELRIRQLDGKNAGQTLAHVVARCLDLGPLGHLIGFDILVQGACHRGPQRGQVGSTVALRDVVRKAKH